MLLLFVFATMLPTATVMALATPQKLVPICCRAHGMHACMMGMEPSDLANLAPAIRQPACPYGQSLRGMTTVVISSDFTARSGFALAVSQIGRQYTADAVATRILRRSVPRGPPPSFAV
jgi:hypothetical protein